MLALLPGEKDGWEIGWILNSVCVFKNVCNEEFYVPKKPCCLFPGRCSLCNWHLKGKGGGILEALLNVIPQTKSLLKQRPDAFDNNAKIRLELMLGPGLCAWVCFRLGLEIIYSSQSVGFSCDRRKMSYKLENNTKIHSGYHRVCPPFPLRDCPLSKTHPTLPIKRLQCIFRYLLFAFN